MSERYDNSRGRYTVIIEVYENDGEGLRLVSSTQCVSAVNAIQAIRRAGMKLVQKLTREAERELTQ
jgi:hypothetical protein